MDFSSINWLAVAASVLASFVIGFIYYILFSNTWWCPGQILKNNQTDPMIWATFLPQLLSAVFRASY
jgi:hypothetical protein